MLFLINKKKDRIKKKKIFYKTLIFSMPNHLRKSTNFKIGAKKISILVYL